MPCGSTGEFSTLTRSERERVVEVVIEQTAGRIPVVPQTGATSTREAVELSRHAERLGADAIMVVAPYYEPFTIAETKRYYADVAGSVSIPVMAYNLPAATGINLTPQILGELISEVPNVKYVKDTSGDFTAAAQLIHEYGDAVSVFVGWDTLFLAALLEGAAGSVIGAANVGSRQLVSIYDSVQSSIRRLASEQWQALFPADGHPHQRRLHCGDQGGIGHHRRLGRSTARPRSRRQRRSARAGIEAEPRDTLRGNGLRAGSVLTPRRRVSGVRPVRRVGDDGSHPGRPAARYER